MNLKKYHIHNVLKAYSQQLAHRKKNGSQTESEPNTLCLSPRKKRLVIIRKVTNSIAAKMKQLSGQPSTPPLNKQPPAAYQNTNQEKTWPDVNYINNQAPIYFVYNTIDNQNKKQTCTLLINDSTFLIKSE